LLRISHCELQLLLPRISRKLRIVQLLFSTDCAETPDKQKTFLIVVLKKVFCFIRPFIPAGSSPRESAAKQLPLKLPLQFLERLLHYQAIQSCGQLSARIRGKAVAVEVAVAVPRKVVALAGRSILRAVLRENPRQSSCR
jgi:hypothetical protein